jgi:hypothetical protein
MPRNVHVDTHNGQTDPLAEQNNRSQGQIQATQITLIIYLAHLYQQQGILLIELEQPLSSYRELLLMN